MLRQPVSKRLDALTEGELELWLTFVNNGNTDLGDAASKLRKHNVDGSNFFSKCELRDFTEKYDMTREEARRIKTLRKHGRLIECVSIAVLSAQEKGTLQYSLK